MLVSPVVPGNCADGAEDVGVIVEALEFGGVLVVVDVGGVDAFDRESFVDVAAICPRGLGPCSRLPKIDWGGARIATRASIS